MTPRFGDIIENGWASEENPTRTGFFVREGRRVGKMNAGRYYEVTDGKGKFWELPVDRESKITVRQAQDTTERQPGPRDLAHAGGVKPSREAELQALLARVEAAEFAWLDDGLLGEVICAALGKEFGSADIGCGDDGSDELTVWCAGDDPDNVWRCYRSDAPDVSLDGAANLVGVALQDWRWTVSNVGQNWGGADLFRPGPPMSGQPTGWVIATGATAHTPQLALLAAMLTALIAQAASPEGGPTGVWTNQSPTPLSKTEVQS